VNRVAYLVSEYDAPSHTFVRREVEALRDLGTDVFTLSIIASDEATSILGRPGLAYVSALIFALLGNPLRFLSTWNLARRHRPPGLRGLLWAQFHFVEAIMLAKVLAQESIGHLHVHFANSGATVGMLAAHYMRLRWSLTVHGISETDYPAGLLLPEKISEASFVACASYFMQAQAMRHVSPEHWHKFRIVRCGVDCARIQKIPVSASSSETPRLICVGRLSPEKGHVGLLKVMRRLLDRGVVFDLNLVGDGPSRTAIEELVDGLDLRDRVRFSGYLSESDTLTAIAESDILVLPSFMEGLPVVLIEAFALGKPVIASRVAGIPELVEHGKSGFLFTPSDLTALEDALERVLAAESTWTEMGRMGQARMEDEFEISTAAATLQRLFLPSNDACDQRGSHAETITYLEE